MMTSKQCARLVAVTGVCLAALMGQTAVANDRATAAGGAEAGSIGPEISQNSAVSFDIPAQPMADALREFGRQSGWQLLVETSLTDGLVSPAIRGTFAPADALTEMLAGTGLFFDVDGQAATFRVRANDEEGATRLGLIRVESVLEGTLTTSYSAPDSFGATRTSTPLIDTPQSIQSVTRQALEDAGATTVAEAYDYLAGVVPENNTGGLFGDDYISRGFGGDNILINGNRSGNPVTLDTGNVERVEALKGPTATLFGRGEPGGMVNVVTKQPLSEPFTEVSVEGGSGAFGEGSRLKRGRVALDTGGPVDDNANLRYRLNTVIDAERSFRKDIEENVALIAPVVEANLGSDTIINAEMTYQYREMSFDRGVPFINGDLVLDRDFNIAGDDTPVTDTHYANATIRLENQISDIWRARLGLYGSFNNFSGGGIQAASVAGTQITLQRRQNDGDYFYLTAQPELLGEFETGFIDHTLLAGLEYSYNEANLDLGFGSNATAYDALNPIFPVVPQIGDIAARNFVVDSKGRNLSLYLQDQIDISEHIKLLAGLRYERIRLSSDSNFKVNGGIFLASQDGFTDDVFLPRAGIVVKPVPQVGVFASYSESYKPPTDSQGLVDANGRLIAPEQGKNYEVGVKVDGLVGNLTGTLSGFLIDKKNVIEADANNFLLSRNLGDVRSTGVEFDLAGEINENISVSGSYAYTNTFVSSEESLQPKGTRLRNIPLHAASLQAAYSFTQGDWKGLRIFGGLVFEGKQKTNTSQTTRWRLPAYLRADIGASYAFLDGMEANLMIKNLTDTEYYRSSANSNNIAVGDPLSAALGLKMQF